MSNHILLTLSMYPWDIIGMCVVEHDNSSFAFGVPKELHRKLTNKIMQAMGFSGDGEYVESYPGQYMTNSVMWCIRHTTKIPVDGAGAYKDDKNIISVHQHLIQRGAYDDVRKTALSHLTKYKDYYNYMLLTQPTTEEMRRVSGFRSAKTKDLWFCSDWKE